MLHVMRGRTIDGKMKESSVDKQTTDVWDMEGLRRAPVPRMEARSIPAGIIGKWLENNCQDDMEMIIGLIMRHTLACGPSGR